MAVLVSGITLPLEAQEEQAAEQALKLLGYPRGAETFLAKKSVDARRRGQIRLVYSVGVRLADGDEEALVRRLGSSKVTLRREGHLEVPRGEEVLEHSPVVVGLGPAGLFAALLLARQGLRPLVLERGADVSRRVEAVRRFWETGGLDPASNVQFGEGGAGTFSDGKLTTRIGDSRAGFVLEELAGHGAPQEIRWLAKPHIGTDLLRDVVRSIREEIVSLGGQVLFGARFTGLEIVSGRVREVRWEGGSAPARAVVLAPGHSARDTFAMLLKAGVALEPKPFSVGVRIEHLQREIDRGLYGDFAGHPRLPRGEYQLSHRFRGEDRAVYTFCMCPGGLVVPAASQAGGVVTNGMSFHARDGANANSALAVSVDGRDFGTGPLDGVVFQQRLEEAAFRMGGDGYRAPAQTVGRFLDGCPGIKSGRVSPTYALGVEEADLAGLLPEQVARCLREGLAVFGRRLNGFDAADSLLTGPETRTSSPVRILRGEDLQAVGLTGLYPCGEGAGYAGGIVSAAVDGVRVAQAILSRYREPAWRKQ